MVAINDNLFEYLIMNNPEISVLHEEYFEEYQE